MKKTLLLHGALGSAKQFGPLMDTNTPESFVTYDFPGHGSRLPSDVKEWSIQAFANDLAAFVVQHNLQGCQVFGHSMGAYVATFCALKHPDLFSNIIALGTKWEWNKSFAVSESAKLDFQSLVLNAPGFVALLQKYHSHQELSLLTSGVVHLMQKLGKKQVVTTLENMSIPLHIYRGTKDKMVTENESVFMASTNELATFTSLIDLKHPYEAAPLEVIVDLLNTD
jgi:pimeloyl-ACP methyl ester carboxylesterase